MVRVVNLRKYKLKDNEVLIKVDRSTPVGNPFRMYDESMRDEVCDTYDVYFDKKVKEAGAFRDYVAYIYRTALKHDVALGCWCAPKRCHADTIASFINQFLSKENNMIRMIKTKRSTNEVLSDKMVTANWWGVYHSSAIMEGRRPRYYDGNKMEIIYHEKDYTLTFIK